MRQLVETAIETNVFEQFDRLCSDAVGPIGIGVSGGSDSVALLELAALWANQRGRALLALTFDHGLREASAGEAGGVARMAEELDVAHQTLRWETPDAGQAAARRARHGGLASAVREAGGQCLMLGHNAGDQRETFLMRARQGSHWYGLAGIRPVSVSPIWPQGRDVYVARPLLQIERGALQDWLRARGRNWVSDPTNANAVYERVRVRQRLSESAPLRRKIDRVQGQLSALRAGEDVRLRQWLSEQVEADNCGGLAADIPAWPVEAFSRALSLLLQVASGSDAPPRGDACRRVAEGLRSAEAFPARTLHGVTIRRQGPAAHFAREATAIGAQPLQDGLWDNRFEGVEPGAAHVFSPDPGVKSALTGPPNTGHWRPLARGRLDAFAKVLTQSL